MRKLFMMLVVLISSTALMAQVRTITGKVTNDQGVPVAKASIKVKGSSKGVSADDFGVFKIDAATGAVLEISGVGFDTKNITIGNSNSVIVSLSTRGGDELASVVVTALGVTRKTKDLGYATAKVGSAELNAGKVTNLQNGLTAKVSGLNINTTNSGVFADTRIVIRGIRSLTGNNQPMLILDGVPIGLGYLSSINPNDIQDVSILKSAAGTAVYGSDGVNGAIVVTTKKGSKSAPKVTFSNSIQFESISYEPKYQTEWGSGYDRDANGNGTYTAYEQQSWGDRFDGSIRQLGEDGPNGEKLMIPYSYLKNGRRKFFNTGLTNQSDISYSAGDFYISAQNVYIDGTVPGDHNLRRALTLRSEKEYGRFKAIYNARYTSGKYDVTTNNSTIYYDVTGAPGQIDVSQFKNWRTDYFSSPDGYYTTYLGNIGKTPYFAKDNYRSNGRSDDFFGNVELNFKAASWLNVTGRVSEAINNQEFRNTTGAYVHSAYNQTKRSSPSLVPIINSGVTDGTSSSNRLTAEVFLNYSKKFGKISLDGNIGYQFREVRTKALQIGSQNLGLSEFISIVARKGEPTVLVQDSKQRNERSFIRASFNYDGWLFVEGTASYEKDSKLVPASGNFKTADIDYFYPGVSASVVLSDVIPALKESKTINFLKVRGALTKTGNLSSIGAYNNETVFGTGLFFPYGSVSGYTVGTTGYQTQFRPEFVNSRELGVELGLFKNRVSIEGSYYNQSNSDQILNGNVSNTTGLTNLFQNAGSFTNEGYEIDLKFTPLVKIRNVSIDLKVNYTNQTSKITSLIDGLNEIGIGNLNYAIVGKSAFVFKLTDYVRDDQGHVIVDKATGNPTVNSNLTTFGKTTPDNIVGLNLNVNWKGLSFSTTWDYRTGNQIVADQLGGFLDDNGISARSGQDGRRPFVFPNSVYSDGAGKFVTNTDVYTSTYGREFWNSTQNTSVSTNYLADGSFWKLREAAISYTLPVQKWFKNNVIKGATIGISGRNLLMWVPKSNQWTDPEFSANGNNAFTGNATGRSTAYNLPPTRFYGANLSINF